MRQRSHVAKPDSVLRLTASFGVMDGFTQSLPTRLSVCLLSVPSGTRAVNLPRWRAWPIPSAPGLPRQASTFQRAAQQWELVGSPPPGRVWHRCPFDKRSHLREHGAVRPSA